MKVPVLLPKIFNYPFTYETGLIKNLEIGDFVLVPFGKSQEIGVIWNKIHLTKKKIIIKNIEKKITKISLEKNFIKFINWFSMYNITSKGMVLKMCLGDKNNSLKTEKETSLEFIKKNKYNLNNEQKKSLGEIKKFGKNFNVTV